jgi:hypothetical protein
MKTWMPSNEGMCFRTAPLDKRLMLSPALFVMQIWLHSSACVFSKHLCSTPHSSSVNSHLPADFTLCPLVRGERLATVAEHCYFYPSFFLLALLWMFHPLISWRAVQLTSLILLLLDGKLRCGNSHSRLIVGSSGSHAKCSTRAGRNDAPKRAVDARSRGRREERECAPRSFPWSTSSSHACVCSVTAVCAQ